MGRNTLLLRGFRPSAPTRILRSGWCSLIGGDKHMDAAAHDRLINLLARTASEHDGEALVAARKANQLLTRHGLSWADVISPRAPERSAPRTAKGSAEASRSAAHRETDVGNGALYRSPPSSPGDHWRASPRQIAGECLGYGLGVGILAGTGVAVLIAVADGGYDPSDYEPAGVAFGLPVLIGFVLWLTLRRWLPNRRTASRGRRYGSSGAD